VYARIDADRMFAFWMPAPPTGADLLNQDS
jgi:hypothetical protein